jgi:hypothetical protein
MKGLSNLPEAGLMLEEMKSDDHPLQSIEPHLEQSQFNLRKEYSFLISIPKKTRYGRNIVPYSISWRH